MNQDLLIKLEKAAEKLVLDYPASLDCPEYTALFNEKFAQLIVRECVEQGKQIQSQSVSNGSEEYNTGREMGIEVFLNQIKKHFGVEE